MKYIVCIWMYIASDSKNPNFEGINGILNLIQWNFANIVSKTTCEGLVCVESKEYGSRDRLRTCNTFLKSSVT